MRNLLPFFLLSFFLLTSIQSWAQKDFKKGFIITNNNDTIQGLINLKSHSLSTLKCEFKKKEDAESEFYSPNDIKAYRIFDYNFYVSRDIIYKGENKKVFLDYLVNGIVDLFYYNESGAETYYLEKDGKLNELTNEKSEVTDKNGIKYSKNSNKYIGMLTYAFMDSPSIYKDVNQTRYEYNSLIQITKNYHGSVCKDYSCITYKKNTKLTVYFEPRIGVIFSKMSFPNSPDKATDNKPFVGFDLRFSSNRISYLWNLLIGVNYSKNQFSSDYFGVDYGSEKSNFDVITSYSLLRIPIAIEYSFPTKKIQPFIFLGFSNVFILSPDYKVEEFLYIKSQKAYTSIVKSNFNTYQFGLIGGIGTRYNLNSRSNIFVRAELEYRQPAVKTGYFFDYQSITSFQLSFGYGYKLGK